MNISTSPASRNAPCPCGSGRRYKACCGAIEASPVVASLSSDDNAQVLAEALAAQSAGSLTRAEAFYRQALAVEPNHADGLHMLGVVRMELGDLAEASALMQRALDLTDWQVPSFLHNFGLVLGRLSRRLPSAGMSEVGSAYRQRPLRTMQASTSPLVSVILPSYNHASFVENAVRSVFEQTYPRLEIIAIDDGSRDNSSQILRELAAHSPIPFQLHTRDNRGASMTLNELTRLCNGEWIQPLNTDDALVPDRVETLLADVAKTGAAWGFGGVACMDEHGNHIDALTDHRVFELRCNQAEIAFEDTVGDNFFFRNPAISTGNLFVRADLMRSLGGFMPLRYHHDWDFCLRALRHSEPAYSSRTTYLYRFHGNNTISEDATIRRNEADAMMRQHLDLFFSDHVDNPWAATFTARGAHFLSRVLSSGMGSLVSADRLKAVATELFATRLGSIQ